jgi:hypothetical protein
MAQIFQTTLVPGKLELIGAWLVAQPWYRGSGAPELQPVGGFRLDDPAGEVGLEFHFVRDASDGPEGPVYHVPVTYRGSPSTTAEAGLIGTMEHGVLGTRWVYDGAHDPVLVAELIALAAGRVQAQHQHESDRLEPTVTGRWSGGEPPSAAVRGVGNDSSSTTVTLGEAGEGGSTELRIVRILDARAAQPTSGGVVSALWSAGAGARIGGPVAFVG